MESRDVTRRTFVTAGAGIAGAAFVGTLGFNRLADAADDAAAEPITQLAKFKLKMEKEAEAVAALQELCKAVEENEPDVLAYVCHRSAKTPEEIVFFEVYKNADAVKNHGQQPHLRKLGASFATLFMGPLEIIPLNKVGGFMR